jgi:hypothetical protein
MIKFPLAIFVYSIEMFTKTMQGMRRMADQGVDTVVNGLAQTLSSTLSSESDPAKPTPDPATSYNVKVTSTSQKEERKMADLDLSGDDLKYVRYSIVFTKRDNETTLLPEREELVDYATDGGSYGGLQIAAFFERAGRGDEPRPAFKESGYAPLEPVPGQPDRQRWTIPPEDRKYVKFIYRVDRRLPKGEAEYSRDQVRVLREIRDEIRGRLGPTRR